MSTTMQLTANVRRPNYSAAGTTVAVKTNHFKVEKLPDVDIQQWDVAIPSLGRAPSSKKAEKERNVRIWSHPQVQQLLGNAKIIYNGMAVAWSTGPMPFDSLDQTILIQAGKKEYEIKLIVRKTVKINLNTLVEALNMRYSFEDDHIIQCISFLSALLRDGPIKRFPTVTSLTSYFDRTIRGNVFDLGGGVQLWRGVFQSARPAPGCMTINVDVAHTAFYQPDLSVPQFVALNLGLRSPDELARLQQHQLRQLNKILKGLSIYTKHMERGGRPPRQQKIFMISRDTAVTAKFEKEGKQYTVDQYFKETYQINLKHKNAPLLEMSGPQKTKLPMELCFVAEGQRFPNTLLTGKQTAEIVRNAAQPPPDRIRSIQDNVSKLDWQNDEMLKNFHMKINPQPMIANARLLPAPTIKFGKNQSLRPQGGQWKTMGKQLFKTTTLDSWGILNFADPRDDPSMFEREVVQAAMRYGTNVVVKQPFKQQANKHGNIKQVVQQFYIKTCETFQKTANVLFFIIPGQGGDELYGAIKEACDVLIGIPSQCISAAKLRKANAQYCDNVWLKVNEKLGGQNTQLDSSPILTAPFRGPVLLLGADVSHPPPGMLGGRAPSIVSLVSNKDKLATKYIGQARSQGARVEMIDEMRPLVKNAIGCYAKNTGMKPKHIVYYRDGVSEGQFAQVKQGELKAIKEACKDHQIECMVTIVICQKRHHTRFFPGKPQDGDRLGNVKAGTLVDSQITHPVDFDFFLTAHTSFKGTARPTHYQVIHDEAGFKAEQMHKLTHDLCYTFARSTTSVSLVPVTYYAHLVGNRVKAYCHGDSDVGSMRSSEPGGQQESDEGKLPQLNAKLRETVWYI
ncbi:Piwi domain-domain-containing protein [Protomyces lactucae-debilis]|uniref:Piwi domain-domain-containing protein n=1 Tax=Protomyces lactucae-debilis TaxID=2754530 RepID=A0A1Y2FE91_PROLT|nr:Piwi domain-containing protein [Protomyces lactucae-debilis]ORY81937.1 Piwi domain-domain-containing protein [Protomyces lactucae-debilis]